MHVEGKRKFSTSACLNLTQFEVLALWKGHVLSESMGVDRLLTVLGCKEEALLTVQAGFVRMS